MELMIYVSCRFKYLYFIFNKYFCIVCILKIKLIYCYDSCLGLVEFWLFVLCLWFILWCEVIWFLIFVDLLEDRIK